MQGRKQYEEKLFTQVQLTRRIPKDNFYRQLKRNLKTKHIYKLTEQYYGNKGKKSLDPVVYFKLCFIKKHEGLSSDLKLINLCQIRLDLLFFLDYNLDDKLPHPNTISKTRHLFSPALFQSIMDGFQEAVEKTITNLQE
ncbi:MAG: transposase [Bacteroidales bacterium]|nr:transposase [Bacteroidales bacterium]